MTGSDLILALIAVGAAAAVLTLGLALTPSASSRLRRRADRIAARGRGERRVMQSLAREGQSDLDAALARFLPQPAKLRARLARTGRSISLAAYLCQSLAVAAAFGGGVAFLGFSPLVAILCAALGGIWLPHLVIGRMIARRVKRFETLFPEALGLIIRGLKAGLPITESIAIVGREVGDPVGEEFRRVADQVRLGQRLEETMWESAKRLDVAEFNFLVVTMSVQRETGGNLAETLENLDSILRRRRQMKLKVKAMSSEARASAMIIGSLPFAMFAILFIVNPSYIMTLLTTDTGHLLLAAGGCSMSMGIVVIARMVRFEI
jgi:tight adherence protein B